MCTLIAKKSKDIIYGYNLDLDPEVWAFKLKKTEDVFSVTIKVGSTVYYTHGVNGNGQFGNLPYMNGDIQSLGLGKSRYRLDLLTDRYIKGYLDYEEVLQIVKTKQIINIPNSSMHSLFGDRNGNMLFVEPGIGFKEIKENCFVATNFPLLKKLDNYDNPFYGKDRYDKAKSILEKSDDFSVSDALHLLEEVKQTGQWGTRLSFVYSKNENAVYYCENGCFDKIEKYKLKQRKLVQKR